MVVIATTATPPSPSPSPSLSPSPSPSTLSLLLRSVSPPPSKLPISFSPPLIAMVVIIATAFVVVTYSRFISRHFVSLRRRYLRYRRRRRSYAPSSSPASSPNFNASSLTDASFHVLSPYGLDDAVIKTIPLSIYTRKSNAHECAVCLLEFEENDYVRTLPVCYHAFHVDCIDIWLGSHATCPLCRAGILRPQSPFVPVMASRIRPSLDDQLIVESIILEEPLAERRCSNEFQLTVGEITHEIMSPGRNPGARSEDHAFNGQNCMLKRSYSFGFERNLGSERLVMELATASPWRYRRGGGGGGGSSFWSKRTSPFVSLTKHRVFSFRNYRGMKSPFFRRRGGFFPFSESSARYSGGGGGGGSSRRSKSFASPMFVRSSGTAGQFSSSRLRSGDPEALLSPERYSRR